MGFLQTVQYESVVETIFMCPFLAATLFIVWKLMYSLFGKIEITFSRNAHVQVFYGIGSIGKKHYIEWDKIKKIYKLQTRDSENQWKREIIIEEKNNISIPLANINEMKSEFLLKILKYYKYKKLDEIVK
jgi:hypothetical protein